jgi:aspartate aminotransferase-like enzyme
MIKKYYLLSPGPTPVPEKVLAKAALPIIHHRSAEFSDAFMEMTEGMQYVFQTKNDVYTLTSSGTGAMETAIVNLLSPGDKIITINGGKFGERWGQIARTYGVEVVEIIIDWGTALSHEKLEETLKANPDAKGVFTQLSETSTGSVYDVKGYAEVVSKTDAILVVDGISGLGAAKCPMDEWKINVLLTGSQKSLMIPPGLAFISFDEKAWKLVESSVLPKYYFDMKKARKSIGKRTTPYTPAVSLVYQQLEANKIIKEQTIEGILEHHAILGKATREAVKAMGLELFSKVPGNVLTSVKTPDGVDGKKLVKTMQDKYLAYISGAQDPMKGKFFRIAHLGYMGAFDVITALTALEMALLDEGYKVELGKGVAVAQKILREEWK